MTSAGRNGDIVGAADAFIGGFIGAGLNERGHSAGRSLLWAHAAGTLSTHKKGAQESQPVEAGQSFRKRWGPNVDEAAGSDAMEVDARGGRGGRPPHPLHSDHAHERRLPAQLAAVNEDARAPDEAASCPRSDQVAARSMLAKSLVDAFGLRPSQRAYQCFQLLKGKDDSDSRLARASVRHLIVAELLLYPELVVRSEAHARSGPGALRVLAATRDCWGDARSERAGRSPTLAAGGRGVRWRHR